MAWAFFVPILRTDSNAVAGFRDAAAATMRNVVAGFRDAAAATMRNVITGFRDAAAAAIMLQLFTCPC